METTTMHPHYEKAHEELQTGRGNNPTSSKIANNTYMKLRDGDAIAVLLHATDILTFYPDGRIKLESGGWRTPTTKDRMNLVLPRELRISQDKGVWFVHNNINQESVVYEDGMIIHPDGTFSNYGNDEVAKELHELSDKIKKYAHDFTEAFMNGDVPAPSGGDCWGCAMTDKKGNPAFSSNHLTQHMEEDYFVPSLLYNAAEKTGQSLFFKGMIGEVWRNPEKDPKEVIGESWLDMTKRDMRKCISKYMKSELNIAQ